MKRGPYSKVAERNEPLLERIRAIKADHPFWGYRRVYRLMKAMTWSSSPTPGSRPSGRSKGPSPGPSGQTNGGAWT